MSLLTISGADTNSAYPTLSEGDSYVPRTYIPKTIISALSAAVSKERETLPVSSLKAPVQVLSYSIARDLERDRQVISTYVQTVRGLLTKEASVASRRAFFEEAVKGALTIPSLEWNKSAYEAHLRAQFYSNLVQEEAARAQSLFNGEENPDALLTPFSMEIDALARLRGKVGTGGEKLDGSPLKDLYNSIFGSYAALFGPLQELHDAYHELATARKAISEGTRPLEDAQRGPYLVNSARMLTVLQKRWGQYAMAFVALFDTPKCLKAGFAAGTPIAMQEAFIQPQKN